MTERLLTPTKTTAWLDCAHFLNLRHQVDSGALIIDPSGFGSLADLLVEKGRHHEADCLADYRSRGLDVLEIPGRDAGESFRGWVARVGNPLASTHDVIYQMPFIHEGIRGIADFLIRVDDAGPDSCSCEPVDAKLARSEAKPGHVLQLCFYAEALQALTGRPPRRMHLWLGSGVTEHALDRGVPALLAPAPVAARPPCWTRTARTRTPTPNRAPTVSSASSTQTCTTEWRDSDSLIYVAGHRGCRPAPAGGGRRGDAGPARRPPAIRSTACPPSGWPGWPDRRRSRTRPGSTRAGRRRSTSSNPPRTPPGATVSSSCPTPDEGDVFLDFEGDPFWRADAGLFFLFGLIARNARRHLGLPGLVGAQPRPGGDGHRRADRLPGRTPPDASPTCTSTTTTTRNAPPSSGSPPTTGWGRRRLTALVETGFFVDLLPVVRNALQVGTESYGLKDLER